LQPRSETVLQIDIADKAMNNKNILINKQELLSNICCVNIYNKVKYVKVTMSLLNISETAQDINVKSIKYQTRMT